MLHSSQSMIINFCYFIVNIFRRGGSSKLLLNCWYAALFVGLSGICECCVGSGGIQPVRTGSTEPSHGIS